MTVVVRAPNPVAIAHDTGEIVPMDGGRLGLPGRVTVVGLDLPEGLSFERWQAIGETLRGVERSVMWWIGDWLRYGEKRYGETYSQALDATDYSYQTLRTAAHVAGRFEMFRRRNNLTFSHHAEVAVLEPPQADAVLNDAEREGWSQKETRAAVSRIKNTRALSPVVGADTFIVRDLQDLIAADKMFGTIYADPPWRYDNQGTRAATRNHYKEADDNPADGMTIEQICALPVRDLAADASHLHVWTTNAFLQATLNEVIPAWGFEFRSTFVWAKTSIGIGNYWRNSHEILLTAVRGDARRFNDHSLRSWVELEDEPGFNGHALRSWVEVDRGKHSAKPEQVRSMIEKASGGPRLELFARSPATGWHVWGNEVAPSLLHPHAKAFNP